MARYSESWARHALEHAAAYIKKGWFLHPLEPGQKVSPVIPGPDGAPQWKLKEGTNEPERDDEGNPIPKRYSWDGYRKRQATLADVQGWFPKYGDVNLGLITGVTGGPRTNNVVVLDVDGEEGKEALYAHHPEMRDVGTTTLVQLTPHGWHMLFQMRPDQDFGSTTSILPSVDTRASGGYIVVAPSVLETGAYTFLNDRALAPVPEWIARNERLRVDDRGTVRSGFDPGWVSGLLLKGAPKGKRNQEAFHLALYFHRKGLARDIIMAMMAPFSAKCDPPLDMAEVRQVVNNATKYEATAAKNGVYNPPLWSASSQGQRFEWRESQIAIDVTNLRQDRSVTGEIKVSTSAVGFKPILYGPVSFDALSAADRERAAKACRERMTGPNWNDKIDDMARLLVENARTGEDFVSILDAPMPTGDGFLIEPLVLANDLTQWFAGGGAGKSFLALLVAATLALGKDIGLGAPRFRRKVGILDWEWSAGRHRRRLEQVMALLPEEDREVCRQMIWHRTCTRSGRMENQVEALKRLVGEHGINFTVTDSAGPASGAPQEDSTVLRYFECQKMICEEGLILAHITKADVNNREGHDPIASYGSVYWGNLARSTWYLQKHESRPGESVLSLTNKKVNDGELWPTPVGVRLVFDDARGEFGSVAPQIVGTNDLGAVVTGGGGTARELRGRIWEMLRKYNTKMTETELLDVTEAPSAGELRHVLTDMEMHRQLVRFDEDGGTRWGLAAPNGRK